MKKYNISYLIFLAITLPVWLTAASMNDAAEWLTHPNIDPHSYAVILMRNDFKLEKIPDSLYVQVSADNHYRLIINGQFISRGPARGDFNSWFYDSVNIAPFLNEGNNLIAVEVVNWGPERAPSYFSKGSAFFLKAPPVYGELLNTGQGQWSCYHNTAHHPISIDWMNDRSTIDFGYYSGNPTDSIQGDQYPWGWQTLEFDDSNWTFAVPEAEVPLEGAVSQSGTDGAIKRNLVPRQVPPLMEEAVPFGRIRSSIGLEEGQSYIDKMGALVIPPDEHVILLIDQGYITKGYPEMIVSGGKNASVRAMYAESLISEHKAPRGNRDEINGKYMVGIKDKFLPDGGRERRFSPTSLRTFRYIQIDIETSDQALIIENYYHIASGNSLELKAQLHTGDSLTNWIMDAGWRTVKLGAHDILFSDAYYEQVQDAMQARLHNLSLLVLTGDDRYLRNAILLFDQSRTPEGLTRAVYPHISQPVIPLSSLAWVNMVHDFMLWKDDKDFISGFESGMRDVLNWFRQHINSDGILDNIDYAVNKSSKIYQENISTVSKNSISNTLYYVYTLRNATKIFSSLGNRSQARKYRNEARRIIRRINRLNRDNNGFYLSESVSETIDSYTQIMAVLSGAAKGKDATKLLNWILDERKHDLSDLSLYFYLFEAMNVAGMQEKLFSELEPWELMQKNGLTTYTDLAPLENEDNLQAECHPGSSAPIYYFFRTVCGIVPVGDGHHEVKIAPSQQKFDKLKAIYPHHLGKLKMELEFNGTNVTGEIVVPEGMNASFIWNGKRRKLQAGSQSISF